MSGKRTPVNPIKIQPDGSITFPASDLNIIKSALLWARIGAQELAKSCEKLAADESLTPGVWITQGRNAEYHAERAARAADLEERIGNAHVNAH